MNLKIDSKRILNMKEKTSKEMRKIDLMRKI